MVTSNWVSEVVIVINTLSTVLSFKVSLKAVFGDRDISNECNIVNTGLGVYWAIGGGVFLTKHTSAIKTTQFTCRSQDGPSRSHYTDG